MGGLRGRGFAAGAAIFLAMSMGAPFRLLAATGTDVGALAPGVQSRGVMVLRASPDPAPTPTPTPVAPVQIPVQTLTPVDANVPVPPSPTPVSPQPVSPQPVPPAPISPTPVTQHPTAVLPAPIPVIKSCPRPLSPADITLPDDATDSAKFDRALRSRLTRQQASVVVDLAAPYAVDETPPRQLNAWLTEVKASHGSVAVSQYCEDSRGFFAFLSRMFGGEPANRYAAADAYNAVLHVDGLDQHVTQIEFRLRSPR